MTATSLIMTEVVNRAIDRVVRTEDSLNGEPKNVLQMGAYDFPPSKAEIIAKSVHEISADIEPEPKQGNRHEAILVDALGFKEAHPGFAANAMNPVRGNARKQWESLTVDELSEQYQVLCIDLFSHLRRFHADRDEDEAEKNAA